MTESCLYEGTVRHRREDPPHEFRNRIELAYIDLDELPALLDGRLASQRPGLVRFRREDYLGPTELTLADAVRAKVLAATGAAPIGPIRMLAQLRSFGHCFNPVAFYYCFDESGSTLATVVAEVTNTPWGERHAYVIPAGEGAFDKALHVSPFMGMDQSYDCRMAVPGAKLGVTIASREGATRIFSATLSLRRHELTPASLRRHAARYPLASGRVLALIYGHALGLKLAGARYFAHPGRAAA